MLRRVRVGIAVAGLVVGACSSPSDVVPIGVDGGADQKTPPVSDGGADAKAACDLTKPFGAATSLASLDTAGQERMPRLTRDELHVYFERDGDLYEASRASVTEAFGAVTKIAATASSEPESSPAISPEGIVLVYQAKRALSGDQWDLWYVERESVSAPWGKAFAFGSRDTGGLNTTQDDTDPYFGPNVNMIYFASQGTGALQPLDLVREVGGKILPQQPFANVNDPSIDETAPAFTPDELTLYFAAKNRAGGAGDWDIWKSTRTATASPYGAPVNVAELNTSEADVPGYVSADGCRLYFTRTVAGNADLYVAAK